MHRSPTKDVILMIHGLCCGGEQMQGEGIERSCDSAPVRARDRNARTGESQARPLCDASVPMGRMGTAREAAGPRCSRLSTTRPMSPGRSHLSMVE
jgi:hypothetical protein